MEKYEQNEFIEPSMMDFKRAEIIEELSTIQASKGCLNPEDVVEHAKNENSCLHKYFLWDDKKAGHRCRLAQAGYLIRRVRVHIVRPEEETKRLEIKEIRRYQSRPSMRDHKNGGYEKVEDITKDENKLREMKLCVMQELIAIKKRYEEIILDLPKTWQAIEEECEQIVDSPKMTNHG